VIALVAALSLAVPAPPAPGQWHQLGAAVKSKPGKQVHFFRTAASPENLAVVVRSSTARPIKVYWWTYCEFESDDATFEEHHQTLTGTRTVVAYPPVLSGATLCYVSVNAGAGGRAAVAAASFDQ
jgi:hypothetical protein